MMQNRLVIESIFLILLFGEINVSVVSYKLDQTWTSLTDTDPIIAFFSKWSPREENLAINSGIDWC
jgi:hypothetical protein